MAGQGDGEKWKKGDENDVYDICNCYCPMCGGGNARTTMLPTKIPMFREIYIMTLVCEECHFRNSEVMFGGEIQSKGEKQTLKLTTSDDLDRQIVKSDSATLFVPKLQFEIPAGTQRGSISTIEGMLLRAAENLEALQPDRLRLGDVDNFHRCRHVIHNLRSLTGHCKDGNKHDIDKDEDEKQKQFEFEPFQVILDDPAGNSFIENPHAPSADPNLVKETYLRTPRQDMALGLQPSNEALKDGTIDDANPSHKNRLNDNYASPDAHLIQIDLAKTNETKDQTKKEHSIQNDHVIQNEQLMINEDPIQNEQLTKNDHPLHNENPCNNEDPIQNEQSIQNEHSLQKQNPSGNLGKQETLKFPTQCPSCHAHTENRMCVTDIPHFKEVIIMSLLCETCGYRSNEIKGGGGIPKFATRIILTVSSPDDLAREVLKSDTAGIEIPQLELVLDEGGLDGIYTTIEGLLGKLHHRLASANPFVCGDGAMKHHLGNDGHGRGFGKPTPAAKRMIQFLNTLNDMKNGRHFPFTIIITDPLSNSFVGPIPSHAIALAVRVEKECSHACYDEYVDPGMIIEEYERTHEQNEMLGLNDIKTEHYSANVQEQEQDESNHDTPNANDEVTNKRRETNYYGTDQPVELPDRLRRLDIRGPDHPHDVAKGTLQGDTTVMGPGSAIFATPALAKRGAMVENGSKRNSQNQKE